MRAAGTDTGSVCSAIGQTLTSAIGTLTSPDYPGDYYNYKTAECHWRVVAPSFEDVSI